MILTDFSGTLFATLHQDLKDDPNPTHKSIRGMCLNTIRSYNKQFRNEYGELMIIMDSGSWRDKEFPEYKWVRRNSRLVDNTIDWEKVWDIFDTVQNELSEHMPYRCIRANGAEGDDIIGAICRTVRNEKILIISNDKDMGVLTEFENVSQFRPCTKTFLELENPFRTLFELFLTGDKDDGIPNIKCDDDFYIEQYRTKMRDGTAPRAPSITKKLKDEMWGAYNTSSDKFKEVMGEEMYTRFLRNVKLIDLFNCHLPAEVVGNINTALANSKNNPEHKMIKFFQDEHLHLLAKYMDDFSIRRIEASLY